MTLTLRDRPAPDESRRYTPEELLALPDEKEFELVNGELVRKQQMGMESCWVAGELFRLLSNYVAAGAGGWAFPQDTGFQCFANDPNRVRKPDAAYIRKGRVNGLSKGYARVPPDLVVEVVSPRDLFEEVRGKVEEYLAADVPLVWLVDPASRTVEAYRGSGSVSLFREGDTLTGEDVLPGFSCRVADLFPAGVEVPE